MTSFSSVKNWSAPYPSMSTAYLKLPSTVGNTAMTVPPSWSSAALSTFSPIAKLRHRELLLESSMRLYPNKANGSILRRLIRMSYWFGAPIPWFSSGRTRSRHADGIERGIVGNVRDAAPALTVSRVGSTAMSLQGGAEAFDEGGCGEWLGQEANCSGLQRSVADAVIRKGRDENERHTITLGAHRR